ncbi:MAG: exodeoxyribonuclease VII small subunit [Eubacteriales bacterium]|nr:exodeoxyribonuclease VII small subunit [Eubacteriales bacterium]
MAKAEQQHSFEEAMTELEGIVSKLENGNIPMDEMMTLYETGMKLGNECAAMLERYEKRMQNAKPAVLAEESHE